MPKETHSTRLMQNPVSLFIGSSVNWRGFPFDYNVGVWLVSSSNYLASTFLTFQLNNILHIAGFSDLLFVPFHMKLRVLGQC